MLVFREFLVLGFRDLKLEVRLITCFLGAQIAGTMNGRSSLLVGSQFFTFTPWWWFDVNRR